MSLTKNKAGFSAVELIIALVVVGVLGFVIFTFVNRKQATSPAASSTQSSQQSATANDVKAAPAINSTEDLTKAEKTLDSTDTSSSTDSAQLDSQLASF